mmetsp:Transcript_1950/g.4040  ORF Transcript_1950/g.4040 Transcript_1950/m.4040 type:complete len:206 (+) Transcript_1950:270-887(+)
MLLLVLEEEVLLKVVCTDLLPSGDLLLGRLHVRGGPLGSALSCALVAERLGEAAATRRRVDQPLVGFELLPQLLVDANVRRKDVRMQNVAVREGDGLLGDLRVRDKGAQPLRQDELGHEHVDWCANRQVGDELASSGWPDDVGGGLPQVRRFAQLDRVGLLQVHRDSEGLVVLAPCCDVGAQVHQHIAVRRVKRPFDGVNYRIAP